MTELVQRQGKTPIFGNLERNLRRFRDDLLNDSARILREEHVASIRQRWYDTGKSLGSFTEEIVEQGDRKTFLRSSSYAIALFGEYGTGRRGAASGGPPPRGYVYGESKGMAARRYSRLAVAAARPRVEQLGRERLRVFGPKALT